MEENISAKGKRPKEAAAASKGAATKKRWVEPHVPVTVLKNLALGIFKGEVFTNSHVDGSDLHLLPSIFLPLESLAEDKEKELAAHPPSMTCAYLRDALSNRTINGYPVFCAACLLRKQDTEALATQYKNLMAAVDAVLDTPATPLRAYRSPTRIYGFCPTPRLRLDKPGSSRAYFAGRVAVAPAGSEYRLPPPQGRCPFSA